VTLNGPDLIAIAVLIAAGLAGCYALFMRKLRAMLADRRMEIADQIGALDNAIRALETRLAERQLQTPLEQILTAPSSEILDEVDQAGPEEIAPEIQAAIAAAAVATVGPNAVVQSVKSATSPWTQQGRVLVQGGHNLRVRR
jgi:hypothetical protein